MQDLAHLIIADNPILVLRRRTAHGVALKIRQHGKLGIRLVDEETFLKVHPDILKRLMQGEVINL